MTLCTLHVFRMKHDRVAVLQKVKHRTAGIRSQLKLSWWSPVVSWSLKHVLSTSKRIKDLHICRHCSCTVFLLRPLCPLSLKKEVTLLIDISYCTTYVYIQNKYFDSKLGVRVFPSLHQVSFCSCYAYAFLRCELQNPCFRHL